MASDNISNTNNTEIFQNKEIIERLFKVFLCLDYQYKVINSNGDWINDFEIAMNKLNCSGWGWNRQRKITLYTDSSAGEIINNMLPIQINDGNPGNETIITKKVFYEKLCKISNHITFLTKLKSDCENNATNIATDNTTNENLYDTTLTKIYKKDLKIWALKDSKNVKYSKYMNILQNPNESVPGTFKSIIRLYGFTSVNLETLQFYHPNKIEAEKFILQHFTVFDVHVAEQQPLQNLTFVLE